MREEPMTSPVALMKAAGLPAGPAQIMPLSIAVDSQDASSQEPAFDSHLPTSQAPRTGKAGRRSSILGIGSVLAKTVGGMWPFNRPAIQAAAASALPEGLKVVGRQVRKQFFAESSGKLEWFSGDVVGYNAANAWWQLEYEDGDSEQLIWDELEPFLVPEAGSPAEAVAGADQAPVQSRSDAAGEGNLAAAGPDAKAKAAPKTQRPRRPRRGQP
ncbi:hypothetical protein WJX84_009390 [Apatococcus fuscideae]|uniref:PTM/DIR17-like Tudor domain-containing protein n=1 Tax=Apatococcus fuscideae TaxID=2026836 RepID=A0AAW1TFA6_9CHLO